MGTTHNFPSEAFGGVIEFEVDIGSLKNPKLVGASP